MLHPLRMKQRDLKNPSCRISYEMRQEKDHVLLLNPKGSSTWWLQNKIKVEKTSKKPDGSPTSWF
jgi:hypothetical protein